MREWVRVNNSKQSFDDMLGFLTGAVDAAIAAQTVCLAAEEAGLGIGYMGTTWWSADEIIEILELPTEVVPVTSIVLGHPNESPELRDRLPLGLIVHREKYQRLTDDDIRTTHADREKSAWARYNAIESNRKRLGEAGITNVTDFYTSKLEYPKKLNSSVSEMLIKTLKPQNLWM
jgi:hypothetical protein